MFLHGLNAEEEFMHHMALAVPERQLQLLHRSLHKVPMGAMHSVDRSPWSWSLVMVTQLAPRQHAI